MKRHIETKLAEWKNKTTNRLPLILNGARQVGKTYILRKFGEEQFKNVVYVNLEINAAVAAYFNDNIAPERLLRYLEASTGERIIPAQLAKENKKFQYKVVQRGGSATLFGASIEWLTQAGVVLKCQRIHQAVEPIAVYADLSAFKLYMGDVGLLTMKSGISQQKVLSGEGSTFMGALTENYVAQQLTARGWPLYYWESSGTAEVDFVLQKGNRVIGVEVKKGENVRSRSLSVFRNAYKPAYCIRFSLKNFGEKDGLKSVPLYAAFCV